MEIKKIEIEGEKIYLKNSQTFGWNVVYPVKNDDGSINFFNLITGGRWINLFIILSIVLIIIGVSYEYTVNVEYCARVIKEYNQFKINISNINKLSNYSIKMISNYSIKLIPGYNYNV